uniref:SPEF2 C-terminal domain-containing protein n=1 Tax=Sphenodon punctatus TaxID=8508 RepID=A0A8D0G415_SPHPU
MFFFTLFADAEKDPPHLNYTEMLLYFASHPDAVDGVYRALSVATGMYILRKKVSLHPEGESCTQEQTNEEIGEEEEEEEKGEEGEDEEKEEEELQYFTKEGEISLETLLRVFQHAESRGGDNHRFSGEQDAADKDFIKIYKELGSEDLTPIKVTLLLKHPFIQDLINNYQEYKLPVSIPFLEMPGTREVDLII